MLEDECNVDKPFDGRNIFRTELLLDQNITNRKEKQAEINYGMHLVEHGQAQDE